MGAQLASYYQKAQEKGGLQAKVKLAMLTKMSSEQAQTAPDSPENLKLFQQAFTQL